MSYRKILFSLPSKVLALVASAGLALAQNQYPPPQQPQYQDDPDQAPHAWRSVNDPPPQGEYDRAPSFQQAPPDQNPGAGAANQQGPPPNGRYNARPPVPAHLTIRPGTFITVRTNQWLSSDRNKIGDVFAATLAEPIVVDGIVVAERGQTVGGRVTEAQKAGRVEGTSRLGIELTDLTLADGQTVPIQSQMISRDGRTTVGNDVGAVAGTTALGAIIGAGVGWGKGAAIGAGAGAAAGILGVLLTRGQPTVLQPESALTFRIGAPVDVATDRAPQAFRYSSDQPDYGRRNLSQGPPPQGPGPRVAGCYNCAPPPAGYYPYAYPGYYPYYGSGFSIFLGGPRYYYRGGYYGRYYRR